MIGYITLCLHNSNFGHPLSIDLVHHFGQSVHPFVICIIILFSIQYTLYQIKSKPVKIYKQSRRILFNY